MLALIGLSRLQIISAIVSGKQFSISAITEVFSFVVSECARVFELSRSGDREGYSRESGLHDHLPAERGEFPHGHYSCSHAGILKLAEVAQARIDGDPMLRARVRFGTYFNPLKAELGVRCIKMREPVTQELAREVLSAAKDAAIGKLTSATYFFPVFAADEQPSKNRYRIGAVEFERTSQFFERYANDWEASIARNIEEWGAEAKALGHTLDANGIRSNYDRIRTHFKEHWWMASVHVGAAEDDIGYQRAENIIDHSCTLVRLFLRSWRGAFIGVSIHRRNERDAGRFMLTDERRYNYVLSMGLSQGDFVIGGFFENLRTVVGVPEIEGVLAKLPTWTALSAAEERLLSTINWFGEAWKESHIEAKIIKFAMCLECLVMTGAKEGLAELIAERVSFLIGNNCDERIKYFAEVKSVYNARSRAVHGDSAHGGLDYPKIARMAEDLASTAILSFAQIVPILGQTSQVESVLTDFFTALKLGGPDAGRAVLSMHSSKKGA